MTKVLHIIDNLDRCAVEHWLLRMMAHAKARGVALDWTFYCAVAAPGSLDAKAQALGARIVRSPVAVDRQVAFGRALRAELERGRYDVLHCHHDLVSGLYLAAAAGLPIRRRLVHVHNADENVLTPSALKQRLYRPVLRRACLALADRIVGISDYTLDTFLAGRRRRQGRDLVHYYGVDPMPFEGPQPDRAAFRRELGLAEDSRILLFGGRLVPEKNPVLAIDVMAALAALDPRAVLVFAGSGSQEDAVRERARALGIEDKVRLIGWRDDLPAVMACADWFILPRPEHPMEGFGLAVVEAQLAGLRLLLSRGVTDAPLLPTARFARLPLSVAPGDWAQAAIALWNEPAPDQEEALGALRGSPMDLDHALRDLTGLHA